MRRIQSLFYHYGTSLFITTRLLMGKPHLRESLRWPWHTYGWCDRFGLEWQRPEPRDSIRIKSRYRRKTFWRCRFRGWVGQVGGRTSLFPFPFCDSEARPLLVTHNRSVITWRGKLSLSLLFVLHCMMDNGQQRFINHHCGPRRWMFASY